MLSCSAAPGALLASVLKDALLSSVFVCRARGRTHSPPAPLAVLGFLLGFVIVGLQSMTSMRRAYNWSVLLPSISRCRTWDSLWGFVMGHAVVRNDGIELSSRTRGQGGGAVARQGSNISEKRQGLGVDAVRDARLHGAALQRWGRVALACLHDHLRCGTEVHCSLRTRMQLGGASLHVQRTRCVERRVPMLARMFWSSLCMWASLSECHGYGRGRGRAGVVLRHTRAKAKKQPPLIASR